MVVSYSKDLVDLSEAGVKYLVVGGIAVNFHGYLRHTPDLDLCIDFNKNNLDLFCEVIERKGYSPKFDLNPYNLAYSSKRAELYSKGMVCFPFVNPDRFLDPIDILIHPAIDFDIYNEKNISGNLLDREIYYPNLNALLDMKKQAVYNEYNPNHANDICALEAMLGVNKNKDAGEYLEYIAYARNADFEHVLNEIDGMKRFSERFVPEKSKMPRDKLRAKKLALKYGFLAAY